MVLHQTLSETSQNGEPEQASDEWAWIVSGLTLYSGPAMLVNAQAEIVWLNHASREWLNIAEAITGPRRLADWIVPHDADDWADTFATTTPLSTQARRAGFPQGASKVVMTVLPVSGACLVLFTSQTETVGRLDVAGPQTVHFAQLLNAVSHELRNPLTPIMGMSEMLMDGDIGALTDAQLRMVRHIYHASSRLTSALDALLDLSRLCAGKRVVEPVSVHIRYCLERISDILKAKPQLNAYTLIAEVPERDLQCVTDPRLLERALLELIDYVLRKSPAGCTYHLRADAVEQGILITLRACPVEGEEANALQFTDDPYLGSAVARELGKILGLKIFAAAAEKHEPSSLLRILVPLQI